MKMIPINTQGKGVHKIGDVEDFRIELKVQLLDSQRAGLGAILVGDNLEADYLFDEFSEYEDKFHDMTDEEFSIHHTRWNIIHIDDAKGLEFSSVIVLARRMSKNQRYIAYTRALDDLYIYEGFIDISGYEENHKKKKTNGTEDDKKEKKPGENVSSIYTESKHESKKNIKNHENSKVKEFFVNNGLTVVDNRDIGGKLWVIGEKEEIRDTINKAMSLYKISGKYASSEEINNKRGWFTKTDK